MSLTKNVAVKLGKGKNAREFELIPTMKAGLAISNRFSGFNNALQAVASNDLGSITHIVRQGVPLGEISSKDLEKAVYAAGTRNIMGDVMSYVTRLANGGRDPAETDAEEAEEAEAAEADEDGDEGNDGEV